ncbi:MAG: hypothetical protein ABIM89_02155 [Mycobacteriales bacterium]
MEHVVFYTAADGSPAYRRTANLDDAVRVVEHLRNAEGREEVHVYSLAAVALNFRPYYRVEINGNASIPAQPDASIPAPFTAPVAPAAPEAQSLSAELAAFAVDAEPAAPQPSFAAAQQASFAEPSAAPVAEAPPAPPAVPEPASAFLPMPAMAQPMPPVEQVPAMASASQPAESDDVDQNGQARGARGLGFFTR